MEQTLEILISATRRIRQQKQLMCFDSCRYIKDFILWFFSVMEKSFFMKSSAKHLFKKIFFYMYYLIFVLKNCIIT